MNKRLELIEQLIRKGSPDPFVWYGRAMELRSLGRLDEALLAYRDIQERFPTYVPNYLMAAQVAEECGDSLEAKRWLEQGLEIARSAGDDHAYGEMQTLLASLEAKGP